MSLKSFFIKNALRLKGMPKEQAEAMMKKMEENPGLMESLKVLEDNKEVKALFEKIQKEIEEKKKTMPEQYAVIAVMGKYKGEVAKYRRELTPLMQMLQN